MPDNPTIRKGGLLLYFKCPDCDHITEWHPETLHSDGTPLCDKLTESDDYDFDGRAMECGSEMEYFGYTVDNTQKEEA
jgi:hypothetical protein